MSSRIIDNKRNSLLEELINCSHNYKTLSIATGYWDLKGMELLIPYIEKYEDIRLIIGKEILIPRYNSNNVESDFPDKDIFFDLEKLSINEESKKTIRKVQELINKDVLKVKILKENFLHAKCFIFGDFETNDAIGIIGSSNFTGNGLTKNYELNSLEEDSRVVQYQPSNDNQENGHLSWFEDLWNDDNAVDWTGEFKELISTSKNGEVLFSPYEMYIKTLFTIYGDTLNQDKEIQNLKSAELLEFQKRNVNQLLHRLKKHGVAMLADSVGLGKTISAIRVLSDEEYRNKRIIVVAPSSLVRQWERELVKQGILGVKVISMQGIEMIEEESENDKWVPVSLFVIDESHNLRNFGGKRFEAIKNWITNNEDAHTLLLTATPINNSIDDITNQILLGSRGEQDLVKVNVRNSEGNVFAKSFFDALQDIKKKISQNKAAKTDMKPIYEEARQVIDPVLREFVIRNTRQSIEAELEGEPLRIDGKEFYFPRTKVKNIKYDSSKFNSIVLNSSEEHEELIEKSSTNILMQSTDFMIHPIKHIKNLTFEGLDNSDKTLTYKIYLYILSLSFIPYRTSIYRKDTYGKEISETKGLKTKNIELNRQIGIYGLIRTNFLKRYESSVYSLLISIKRYKSNLEKFEDLLNKKGVLINLGDLNGLPEDLGSEIINLDDDKNIKAIISNGKKVDEKVFNIEALKEDIQLENKVLKSLIEILENIKDKKLEKFIKHVESIDRENFKKILIFSFYSDTIEYLEKELITHPIFSKKIAFVSGKNKKNALQCADNFSPISREKDQPDGSKQIDILFTTDVLSEGQNLQDCGYLINYDLHWNPVRMIQRNGRINRLGSIFSEISLVNIVPEQDLEEIIKLVEKLEDKIDLIQTTIGNDSSVLGEQIKHIDFKGIYDSNDVTSSAAYEELEKESNVFSDDQFINDLKHFLNNSDESKKELIQKIPTGKWGALDNVKDKEFPADSIVFAKSTFDNSRSLFTFYRNSFSGDKLGILLNGEALEFIKSDKQKRTIDKIKLDKEAQFNIVKENGMQITKYETNSDRLTPSQTSIIDEARNYGWDSELREKLEIYITSRNVFKSKAAAKYIRKIRKLIKDGDRSQAAKIFEDIKNEIDNVNEVEVKITSIDPIFGFAKDNK